MKTEKLTLGELQTNCYIIYDDISKEAAIIDPASKFNIIRSKIDELSLKTKYIILTHAHCDHIGALDECKNYTGAEICIGAPEASALNNDTLTLCNYFGCSSPDSVADIHLHDSDTLKLGAEAIKVLYTPGHTLGSISLLYNDCLISGDTLFYESVGRTDFPTGNALKLMDSIKTKLFTLPDNTKVYPGHGMSTTIMHEKNNNMFVW